MKNKLIKLFMTSSLLMSSVVLVKPVFADSFNSEIEENEQEAEEHAEAADYLDFLMEELTSEMTSTESALNHLTDEIQENEKFLDQAVIELEKAREEMLLLEEEIAVLEDNIEKRSKQLEEQARKVQINGNSTSYIDFILNSESLTDVLARLDLISTIVNRSNQMIEDQQRDKDAIIEKTNETERKIVRQNALAGELEDKSVELENQKVSEEALVTQLKIEQTTVDSEKQALLEERNDALIRAEELKNERELVHLVTKETKNKEEKNLSKPSSSKKESSKSKNKTEKLESKDHTINIKEKSKPKPKSEEKPTADKNPKPKSEEKPKVDKNPKPKPIPEAKEETAPAPDPSGNILEIANQYIGTPYLFGGTTTEAFDCSGYTSHVFAEAGKNIPRNSRAQYANAKKVSNPKAGDLVFFKQGSGIDHVGIYLGGNQFIGSQSSTGVASARLDSGYWSDKIVGYGRY
ncbi:MAG: NlpC/P60 family protein [Atopostipes sp.]|nr:NlpC/P60 family protein [Atopostipes sp.]